MLLKGLDGDDCGVNGMMMRYPHPTARVIFKSHGYFKWGMIHASTVIRTGRRGSFTKSELDRARTQNLETYTTQQTQTKFQKIETLFEDPSSSTLAFRIQIFIFALIIISSATMCIETLPTLYEKHDIEFFVIETICMFFFTIEYLIRFIVSSDRIKFVKSPMNIIDLVSILPYYLELILTAIDPNTASVSNIRIIRTIRLTRVVRILKMSKYSAGLIVMKIALSRSMDALGMLCFFLGIAIVLFSSGLYFTERGHWNSVLERFEIDVEVDSGVFVTVASQFQSIPASMWWCITTLTTVGYGDAVPITGGGKAIASVTMIIGILIIALPTSVIGSNFMNEWEKYKIREVLERYTRKEQEDERNARIDTLLSSKEVELEDMSKKRPSLKPIDSETRIEVDEHLTDMLRQIDESLNENKAIGTKNCLYQHIAYLERRVNELEEALSAYTAMMPPLQLTEMKKPVSLGSKIQAVKSSLTKKHSDAIKELQND